MKLSPGKYVKSDVDRAVISTTASFFVNLFLGILKLCLGIHYSSMWFSINALYYILLSVARGQSLRKYVVISSGAQVSEMRKSQMDVYRHSGALICLLSVSYLLDCMRMYFVGDSLVYRGFIVYGVAAAALIKIGFAVSGIKRAGKMKSPIFSSIKTINLFDASVSIVVALCASLRMCGYAFAIEASATIGMAVSVLFFFAGTRMMLKGKQEKRKE